jgi:hypothetical protein
LGGAGREAPPGVLPKRALTCPIDPIELLHGETKRNISTGGKLDQLKQFREEKSSHTFVQKDKVDSFWW